MADLLGIVGSVSNPSKTRAAVETALDAARRDEGVEVDVLHLAEYNIVTADGRKVEDYEGDTADALDLIIQSEAYVVGTPVYRAAYSGALKNLFDMVPRGMWQADVAPFENSAVGLVATGATPHHYLSVEKELAPVMSFFGAHVVGSGIYADSSDFDDYEVVDGKVKDRLETLGRGTVHLARAIKESEALGSLGPQF